MGTKALGHGRHAQEPQRGVSLLEIMFVVLATLVLAAIGVPKIMTVMKYLRAQSDARTIAGDISLTKMRASADFTKARIHADLSANTYQVDVWSKSGSTWVTEQSSVKTLTGVTIPATASLPSISAPPNTQATFGQAAACLDDSGSAISNSACIVFNSRGIPVNSSGVPDGTGAIYVTDGASVYGVTVSAMGLIQTWRSSATTATWGRL
jgi:Tfp pilus assembly protein FimT